MNQPRVGLDFRSGGWVLALAGVLCVGIVAWRVGVIVSGRVMKGTGGNVESFEFDLSNLTIPRSAIQAGPPRETLRALVDPPVLGIAEVDALTGRNKYLVAGDLVIGLRIGSEARAYPIQIMNWHEVVNDTLGETPIAVTYNPLCDSVRVFDRRVDGETLEFGLSGLMWNSNQLFFDRTDTAGQESLWSQLLAEALSGPKVGRSLQTIPAALITWGEWKEREPETSVLARNPAWKKLYQQTYGSYFSRDTLYFPVEPLPPEDSWPPKTSVVVVSGIEQRMVFPYPALQKAGGVFEGEVEGRSFRLEYLDDPPRVDVDAPGLDIVRAFWFSWYATHPNDPVFGQ